jgi:hypothetical protein
MKMPEWKLHTTQEDDVAALVKAVYDGTRRFIWLHVSSEQERDERVSSLNRQGLTVLQCVPIWFVVACAPETPHEDQLRMCYSILNGADADEAQWRGEMFGYSQEEINWYIQEVEAAWKRYAGWACTKEGA